MKKRFFALFLLATFVFSSVGFTVFADTKTMKKADELTVQLPASDMVMTFDAQKLFNQALPQILSSTPEALAEMNRKIEEIKSRTGIDVRQFQQVAVGLSSKMTGQNMDFEPFVLARGDFNPGSFIALAKLASNGKYREEKIGNRTVYFFSFKETLDKKRPQTANVIYNKIMDHISKALEKEIGITTLDDKTVAFGTAPRMREALEKRTRVSAEVLALVNRTPNAVLNFGGILPNGMAKLLPIENDEFGKNINAIRQFSGALNVGDGKADLAMMMKTVNEQQARELYDMIEALRPLGKMVLGGSKSPNGQVYARMLESAKMSRAGNEILFDLQIPQTDIDILVGKK